ncbi:MAG: hypothetical protein AUJ28_02410 [Parcubacteria group bacterium CG1_02_37_51]|uniref:Type II secretion system protein GspG C-terminal domain-containing protein n=2 Tax=Candidatus Komeiliibacteriota TaxID=1817908 RepID=A0A2M8DS81_9BACT|nr:MAG: hypothetical protein AUJ28_02410 [Parcubacteria group bacterium CG1_02_37_51]PIY94995.1 MAG: hypothetical protein COY67_01635 [Candidatus Komeilibacteria bacterium CG_4_10_14_0_8_um_filter_37_78]PJC02230.1 MAG: hypothetical protein CO073_00560 [Candidatus Komeilibacteria bacterium CG_4_9_14_0_8_um_filter_36_9]
MENSIGTGQVFSKILIVGFMIMAVIFGAIYMNKRWSKIRDIRRQGDAQAIVKALNYYYSQYGYYPDATDDDEGGWDYSNDTEQGGANFMDTLVKAGYLVAVPFDPKNDDIYYYRYKKFASDEYDCAKPFYVFQVARFETEDLQIGYGSCPNIDWTKIAPNGYTAMEIE